MNKKFSLLYNQAYNQMTISESTARDIGLDRLKNLTASFNPDFGFLLSRLTKLPVDSESIVYRQDIFEDLLTDKNLMKKILKFIDETAKLEKRMNDRYNEQPDHRRKLRWKVFTLEQYVNCVEFLYDSLNDIEFKSKGLSNLLEFLKDRRNMEKYQSLKQLIPDLHAALKNMRNMQIRFQFDSKLQPHRVELLNIGNIRNRSYKNNNDTSSSDDKKTVAYVNPDMETEKESNKKGVFHRLIQIFKQIDKAYTNRLNKRMSSKISERFPELRHPIQKLKSINGDIESLFLSDIQRIAGDSLNRLSQGIDTYLHENAGRIINIASELYFYTTAVDFANTLKNAGIPMCKPVISKDNICRIEDCCDIITGLQIYKKGKTGKLVPNNVDFTEKKRTFILTGPNQGGKTTFLRGVAIAQILFQGGLYVPAKHAKMSPVDMLLTHFPKNEQKLLGEGRLGEELKDLSDIFDNITENSMLLLNESVSSTAAYDSFIIGKNIVKALRDIGSKVIFATHLHELAEAAVDMNNNSNSKNKIITLSAGVKQTTSKGEISYSRTYKISEGKIGGKSYAKDIAKQHGMTYEQMEKRI